MVWYEKRKWLPLFFSALLLVVGVSYFGENAMKIFTQDDTVNVMSNGTGRRHFAGISHQCSEVTHVVFLKIHKTGSGTLASVLIHFGVTRNLTFALSKFGTYFSMEPILMEHILPIAAGKHYDMLVTHSTYNSDTIKQAFPNDTRIIGTIREPFSQFISSFYFFPQYRQILPEKLRKTSNATKQIGWLINNGYEEHRTEPLSGNFFFNLVSLKFGIPYSQSLNVSYVRTYIDSVLDKDLDFVLVQEYFDESLVLLKRRFCWQLSDIIYLSYHVNPRTRTDHVYTDQLIKRHKELAVAEYMIYDHFHKKFWETVWAEGPDLFDEMRVFKAILRRIQSFCANQPSNGEILMLPSSQWNRPFTILGKRCRDMQADIPTLIGLQKKKQSYERFKDQSENGT